MHLKEPGFAARLATASKAKQTGLEKFARASVSTGDKPSAEKQLKAVELAAARELREAQRKAENQVAAKKRAEDRAAEEARKAQLSAEARARKVAEHVAKAAAEVELKNKQKAACDLKYAARKARTEVGCVASPAARRH
jgi:hypothetical protein